MNSEPKCSTEPDCPLIKPHLGELGSYLASCPGLEAFPEKQSSPFTRTCFAPKSFHL